MTRPSGGSLNKRDSGSQTGGTTQPAPGQWPFELALGVLLLVLPTLNAWLAGSWRWYHWLGVIGGLVWLGVFSALRLRTRRSNTPVGDGQEAVPGAVKES
jgi:hypothetical protein